METKASITSRFRPTWKTCLNASVIKAMEIECTGSSTLVRTYQANWKRFSMESSHGPCRWGGSPGSAHLHPTPIHLELQAKRRTPHRLQLDDVDGVALDGYLIQFDVLEKNISDRVPVNVSTGLSLQVNVLTQATSDDRRR